MNFLKPTTSILLSSPLMALSILSSSQVTLAQPHFGHHHPIVGRDSLETLVNGDYAGLENPNYNRLSLVFPHPHEPAENSHFHAIGVYSYTGDVGSPTILPTSINNQLPEYFFDLPPLPLVPGTGAFRGKMVNAKTDENIYSDLKTRPVAHLTDDLSDPYINAIYHTSDDRWNGLLGDDAVIALELLAITPGLGVANEQGQALFNGIGDEAVIGQGDYFSFTPIFHAPKLLNDQTYSATFRLLDLNSNEQDRWLPSGEFTINFQATGVPEPSTIIGLGILGTMALAGKLKNKSF